MRASLAVAGTELRRFARDRSNIFFVLVFPLLLVVLIGSQFGAGHTSGTVTVSGPDGPLRSAVADQLRAAELGVTFADADEARTQLARGRADVGVVLGDEAERAIAAGQPTSVEVVVGTQARAQAVAQQVRGALGAAGAELDQALALEDAGIAPATAETVLAQARSAIAPARVEVVDTSDVAQAFAGASGLGVGAASQLLLFTFLTALAGSATLIQARRYGVVARTLAAPVSTGELVRGEALGRWVIAFGQGVYIMVGTALLFGVGWGNLGATLAVVALFAAVAAGAGMVLGSALDNDSAASGLGVGLALVLAALGGCMLPLELFPDTLRTVAHLTPHAWAYEALADVTRHGAGVADVLPQLGVLAAFAVVVLGLGTWLLRRSLARAI